MADVKVLEAKLKQAEQALGRAKEANTKGAVYALSTIGAFLIAALWGTPLLRERYGMFVGDRTIAGRTVKYTNVNGSCFRSVHHDQDRVVFVKVGQQCIEMDDGTHIMMNPTDAPNEWAGRRGDDFLGNWWRGL